MQRHEANLDLRVIETHPCTGQYDCRTVLRRQPARLGDTLLDVNLQSGNAHLGEPVGRPRDATAPWAGDDPHRLPFVEALVQTEHRMATVQYLEARLGLPSPPRSPATSRHALSYRIMAEVAARHVFDGPRVRWENGRVADPGYGSADPVRSELLVNGRVAEALREQVRSEIPLDLPGFQYWMLFLSKGKGSEPEQRAIIDALDGAFYKPEPGHAGIDLMAAYDEVGRSVPRLVNRLLSTT